MISRSLQIRNVLKALKTRHNFSTSSFDVEQKKDSKPYRMPETKEIELYKTQFPVRLHNNRVLLYLNKQKLSTPMVLQTPYAGTIFGLLYLIRNNPWYLTFPASLPLMILIEIVVFFRWIANKKHFKYIVERVYLYPGNFIEFLFSNKLRRKFKDIEGYHCFQNPIELITPPQAEDGTEAWTQRGFPFPETLDYKLNPKTQQVECAPPMTPLLYCWTKYTANYQPYIFPKYYDYANWQILVPLFSGRYIDYGDSVNVIHEFENGKTEPTIEEELQWTLKDNEINEALRRQKIKNRSASAQKQ